MGMWNPEKEYWGEEDDPIEVWAKPIIARGERPAFEMEQVLPGADPDELSDPIIDAVDLKDAGNRHEAVKVLMELCESDLRCLDAHAHLGHFIFDSIRKRPSGITKSACASASCLSLTDSTRAPVGPCGQSPFLRCLQGYGLCLWRLKRFAEAVLVFERMLWLNPSDNQGIRFLINDVGPETHGRQRSKTQTDYDYGTETSGVPNRIYAYNNRISGSGALAPLR